MVPGELMEDPLEYLLMQMRPRVGGWLGHFTVFLFIYMRQGFSM